MTHYMPGYRLHAAAKRASIQFVTAPSIVGVDYRHQHKFSRGISDGLPLEKTPPLEPYWKSALGLLGMIVFAVAATFLAWAVQ